MITEREWLKLLAIWTATHFLLVAVIFFPEIHWDNPHGDVQLYFHYADFLIAGKLPYRDFSVEYPPLALLFFALPRLFSQEFYAYLRIYNLEVLAVEAATLTVILKVASRCSLYRERRLYPLYAYLMLVSSSGQIFLHRYDALPAFLAVLAIHQYLKGHEKSAWTVLACGVMTKVYPVLLAPLFLLTSFSGKSHKFKDALSELLIFLGVLALILSPFLVLAGGKSLQPFLYNLERGIQLESTYASLLLFTHSALGLPVRIVFPFRAYEVLSPLSSTLSSLAMPIMLMLQFGLYLLYFGHLHRGNWDNPQGDYDHASLLVRFCLLSTLAFLLSYKVFSPQFLAWLFPLVALLKGQSEKAEKNITATFIVACGLTQIIFPLAYDHLVAMSSLVMFVLFVRNLLLVACFLLILHWESGDRLLSRVDPLFFMVAGVALLFAGVTTILLYGWRPIFLTNVPVCHPGILLTIGLNLVLCIIM